LLKTGEWKIAFPEEDHNYNPGTIYLEKKSNDQAF